jgi:cation transport regulator ChaB
MGWNGGSHLFSQVIEQIKKYIPDEDDRVEIYRNLINAFWDEDWDTQDECMGEDSAYDIAWKELYQEHYEEPWGQEEEDDE